MYIPDFLLETEDFDEISVLLGTQSESKLYGCKYYSIDNKNLEQLIIRLYKNSLLDNKQKVEFNIRACCRIFTDIIKKNKDKDSIFKNILGYYPIDNNNAGRLLAMLGGD